MDINDIVNNLSPQLLRMVTLPQFEQGTQDWLDQRKLFSITGSDVASVLTNTEYSNPYKSYHDLYFEKCGLRENIVEGPALDHGHFYEDEALLKYMDATGEQALTFGLIPHPTISWLAASPDAVTLSNRMVEIKVS